MNVTLKVPGAVFFFLCLPAGVLLADTLYLRDGKSIEGKITGFTSSTISIRSATGVQTVPKTNVSRVAYGASVDPAEKKKQDEARKKIEEQKRRAEEERRAEEQAAREAAAEPEREPEKIEEPAAGEGPALSSIVKSAILPGWGHLAEDAPVTGGVYMGLTALAVGATYGLRTQALEAAETYHANVLMNNFFATRILSGGSTVTDEDQRRSLLVSAVLNSAAHEPYASAVNNFNAALGVDLALYLLQLAHIAFFPPTASTGSLAPEFNFAVAPVIGARQAQPLDSGRRHGGWDAHASITFFIGAKE